MALRPDAGIGREGANAKMMIKSISRVAHNAPVRAIWDCSDLKK